jgi:SMP-30/Gluconolactonase/LRE-like region
MNRQPGCGNPTALMRVFGGVGVLVFIGAIGAAAAEQLFVSKQLTPGGEYNKGIEGPAVNAAGDLFVVSFKIPGADPNLRRGIGRVKNGTAQSRLGAKLPLGSRGSGIRFDLQGRMYVADFKKNAIHVFEPGSADPQPYFVAAPDPNNPAKPAFTQPNDIAIARDGTIYASDPDFGAGTGRIWRITRGANGKGVGAIMTSTRTLGITNGLDLSPDNKTLYVSESKFNHADRPASVWAYRIDGTALVADPAALKTFDEGGDADGLRVDTDGRIFVARPEAGEVFILVPPGSPGAPQARVTTAGKNPNNLTFGGADGRDVYVTQNEDDNHNGDAKRFVERFRTDRPGREPCLLTPAPADCRPVP